MSGEHPTEPVERVPGQSYMLSDSSIKTLYRGRSGAEWWCYEYGTVYRWMRVK